MTFSDIVGLKIISVYEKKMLGYVIDAIYSQKTQKITHLVVSDKNEETTKLLNTRHILCLNKNFALIKNATYLVLAQSTQPLCGNIVNKLALCTNGNSFGKIGSIGIDDNWFITDIKAELTQFLVKDIYGVGDVVFVKDNSKKRHPNFAPRHTVAKPKSAENLVVQTEPSTPISLKVQPNGLIGKRLKRDFIVLGNRVLARKNATITNELILSAKRLNVLPELELLAF